MSLDMSTVSITESHLDYNKAKYQGGAVYDEESSTVDAFASQFQYNEAEDSYAGTINA